MRQVQVNLRVSPEELAAIDAARGSMPRNAWVRRELMAATGRRAPARPAKRPARPVSVRAPRGCRVVNVPRALREDDEALPGQIDIEEALAS